MTLLIQKFGGTSVKDLPHIRSTAEKTVAELRAGRQVIVVVSAMGHTTDELIRLSREVSPDYRGYEYDSILSTGEQISSGLYAMILHQWNIQARSWLGWQIPIRTDSVIGKGSIVSIETERIRHALEAGEVPVIAGFQGISPNNQIITLGRGGSDTTAVALTAAFQGERCDIYTDVDGVYTADPRIIPQARKLNRITYEEMLEMSSLGAQVLQTRAVMMAMKYKVAVQVLSSFTDNIGSMMPGTLVSEEDTMMEQNVVSSITSDRDAAKVTLIKVADRPGVAAAIFSALASASLNVDMIVQNISEDGKTTDLTLTVAQNELSDACRALEKAVDYQRLVADEKVAKVSIVGIGMIHQVGVAQKMFKTLAERGINIQVISTSEIKITVLIAEEYMELAVRVLHTAYGLDRKPERA